MFQETKPERSQKDSTGCFSYPLRWRVHIHGDSWSGGIGRGGRVCEDMAEEWLAGDGVTGTRVSHCSSQDTFKQLWNQGWKGPVWSDKTPQSMNLKNLFLITGPVCCYGRMVTPIQRRRTCNSVSFLAGLSITWNSSCFCFPPVMASTAIIHRAARSHCSAGRHKKLPNHGEHKHTTRLLFVPPKGSPTETTHFWTLCGFF